MTTDQDEQTVAYPEQYLHVCDCHTGQEWIKPIGNDKSLDLRAQVKAWVDAEFCGELALDGELMPRLDGDYYAAIYTDGRAPGFVCWTSGGFYLKATY